MMTFSSPNLHPPLLTYHHCRIPLHHHCDSASFPYHPLLATLSPTFEDPSLDLLPSFATFATHTTTFTTLRLPHSSLPDSYDFTD